MALRWILVATVAAAVPCQSHAKADNVPHAATDAGADLRSSGCSAEQLVPDSLLQNPTASEPHKGLNAFTYECLGKRKYADFNIADLAVSLAATSDSGQIEVAPGYTWRRAGFSKDGASYRSSYFKVRAGIRAAVGSDTKAADLLDLTKFQFTKGLGGVAGIEWGRSSSKPRAVLIADIQKGLDAAAKDCIDTQGVTRATFDEASTKCSGAALSQWMRESKSRSDTYYGTIVKPIWGYDALPLHYVGLEGSYARPELSFFPLIDPAMTGYPLLGALPAGFPDGKSRLPVSKYYVTLYGGLARQPEKKVGWGLAASVSYRRDALFPKDTEKQSICAPPSGSYTRCYDVNIAPPYQTEGLAFSTSVRVAFPRFAFLATTGVDIKLSYAADTDQFAVDAPLYLFADSEGKIGGGIRGGCTTDGKTSNTYPIKGDCKAAFFIGGKFKLAGL